MLARLTGRTFHIPWTMRLGTTRVSIGAPRLAVTAAAGAQFFAVDPVMRTVATACSMSAGRLGVRNRGHAQLPGRSIESLAIGCLTPAPDGVGGTPATASRPGRRPTVGNGRPIIFTGAIGRSSAAPFAPPLIAISSAHKWRPGLSTGPKSGFLAVRLKTARDLAAVTKPQGIVGQARILGLEGPRHGSQPGARLWTGADRGRVRVRACRQAPPDAAPHAEGNPSTARRRNVEIRTRHPGAKRRGPLSTALHHACGSEPRTAGTPGGRFRRRSRRRAVPPLRPWR